MAIRLEMVPPSRNSIDADFDALEREFVPEEYLIYLREAFSDMLNRETAFSCSPEYECSLTRLYADGRQHGLRHYYLPGIPFESTDLQTIREGYGKNADYMRTEKRCFIRVRQGEMWMVDKTRQPHFSVAISECSVLVADCVDTLVVAHISFSDKLATDAVVERVLRSGAALEHVYVVASVGEDQAARNREHYMQRYAYVDEYMGLGIPERNIMPFVYEGATMRDGRQVLEGLARVTVGSQGILTSDFDVELQLDPWSRTWNERMTGSYRNPRSRLFEG